MNSTLWNRTSSLQRCVWIRFLKPSFSLKVKLIFNRALFQVVRSFLNDSIYSNMAPLFIGPTVLIVSKEPKAKEMLRTLRASPQMTLLGMFIFCDADWSFYNVTNIRDHTCMVGNLQTDFPRKWQICMKINHKRPNHLDLNVERLWFDGRRLSCPLTSLENMLNRLWLRHLAAAHPPLHRSSPQGPV